MLHKTFWQLNNATALPKVYWDSLSDVLFVISLQTEEYRVEQKPFINANFTSSDYVVVFSGKHILQVSGKKTFQNFDLTMFIALEILNSSSDMFLWTSKNFQGPVSEMSTYYSVQNFTHQKKKLVVRAIRFCTSSKSHLREETRTLSMGRNVLWLPVHASVVIVIITSVGTHVDL